MRGKLLSIMFYYVLLSVKVKYLSVVEIVNGGRKKLFNRKIVKIYFYLEIFLNKGDFIILFYQWE